MLMPTEIIAIDGPAGAGKSTVARAVAERLGLAYLDTGAMYRAATWWALHNGVDLDDAEALAAATERMPFHVEERDGTVRVWVGEHDVTEAIRTPEITGLIYKLDEISAVRRHLVALQQRIAAERPTVAEGRDLGTVVFPAAHCKIFLTASIEERAKRRAADLARAGTSMPVAQVAGDLAERDHRTSTRADSPLRQADDAVVVDTTAMTQEEVIAHIAAIARERLCLP